MNNPLEKQVGGDYYKTLAIQPIEYSMKNNLDACQHSVVKYVTRFRAKNGIEDLKKARHFIDILIKMEVDKQAQPLNIDTNPVYPHHRLHIPEGYRYLLKSELLGPGVKIWGGPVGWNEIAPSQHGLHPLQHVSYICPVDPS
jgi:hypothetical protein